MKSEYCDQGSVLKNYTFNYEPKTYDNLYNLWREYKGDGYEKPEDAMNICLKGMLNY